MGVYLIIALIILGYNKIIELLINGANSNYIVNVELKGNSDSNSNLSENKNIYSFHTNVTGYFKFMSLMEGYEGRASNSFWYAAIVGFNFIFFICMILRTVAIAVLIIIAPISIFNYMRGLKARAENNVLNLLYFENWLSFFIRSVIWPMFAVIIYRFIILTLA